PLGTPVPPAMQPGAVAISASGLRSTVDVADKPPGRGLKIGGAVLAALALVAATMFSLARLTKPNKAPTAETPTVEKATILVAATPPEAKLFVDDVLVPSNPGQIVIARDGNTHRVRAEAHGYLTKNQAVIATLAAISVDLSLEHVA